MERDFCGADAAHGVAVVVFEVVNTPGGEALCVGDFVVEGAGVPGACHGAGGGVHAVLEVLGVNGVGDVFHAVGEAGEVGEEILG